MKLLKKDENDSDQDNVPIFNIKGFKIQGKIGYPEQKDKLTFTSLNYQIENGLKRGYSDIEICSAVVDSISTDLELMGYLEGKVSLTLPSL